MSELFTQDEIVRFMKDEVHDAGGATKWLRKHKLSHLKYINHMIEDGRAATLEEILPVIGFKRVVRYEPLP